MFRRISERVSECNGNLMPPRNGFPAPGKLEPRANRALAAERLNAVVVNRSVHGGVCAEVSALWGRSGGDLDGAADCEAELSIGAALVDGDFGEAV
jgi:hypothetical protein